MLGGHIPRFTGTALHQLVARERGKVRAPGRVSMAFRWNMVKHGLVMCHGPTLDDYIPGNPKASFFSIVRGWHVFSVITGLLVGLKARSGEPKYGLLTRVKSKKNFGFFWFLSILFGFFLANCWVECAFGPTLAQSQSNWRVFSIKCYLFSVKMKQAHTACWRFFSVIAEKNMQSWKFDYKNMSLLVIRHMNEKILTFGFPGMYI